MEKYKKSVIKLMKNPWFIVPVIIVAIASFGYLLTHDTVNIDTLASNRYYDGTELIAQGRLVNPLLDKIFNVMEYKPFFVNFLAVLFLILATLLYSSLFDVVSKSKIKLGAYTIFACLFISYPLSMEVFLYEPMGLSIALGFNFTALSLIAFYEFLQNKQKRYAIFSVIFLWCAISIYESFAAVYIVAFISIILIETLYNQEKKTFKEYIKEVLWYIVPLIIAIVLNTIVVNLIQWIWHIEKSTKASKTITYLTMGLKDGIKNLIQTVIISYGINAFGYFPITSLVISIIVSIIMGIVYSVKRKNAYIILIILAMNLSLLSLSIIQGQAAIYRTCQQFPLFVAVVFMIFAQAVLQMDSKKVLKNVCIFMICMLIFYQAKDLYGWQYKNDLRYQREKEDMITIANQVLSNYGNKKPVVFTGNYGGSGDIIDKYTHVQEGTLHYKVLNYFNKHFYENQIKDVSKYRYTLSNVRSYVYWATTAFKNDDEQANMELIKFFNLLGYDIKAGTKKMYQEALTLVKGKPHWPKEGSIIETEEYIIVNF